MLNLDLHLRLQQALQQLNNIILDKEETIELALCCLLARGHVLLEDLPGVGKTTLAKAFAATLGLDFHRIQFTADLLPADVLGFSTLDNNAALHFHAGAVFTQLLLADEINRASPKSQSALLEAMEERQVTIEGKTYPLPQPFFVFATQNPQEQIGTFALPESQLDRFLMCLSLGYPSPEQEIALLSGQPRQTLLQTAKILLSADDILALQHATASITVSKTLAHYVQQLLAFTRDRSHFAQGLSTRAGIALIQAARAYALLKQSTFVLPEHVQKVFIAVVQHRLPLWEQPLSQRRAKVAAILEQVPVPL